MSDPLVSIRRLTYRYPRASRDALAGIDIDIEPGELVVMAGRSGSGKTTLLRACCGLVPHYHGGEAAGSLAVAGMDVREHGPADLGAAVGLVAQDPETQVVSTTVRAELELPLEMRAESVAARARAVEEVALALAMPHLLDRTVDTLSGGELQRVALAAALVGRPRLVLLDEPTSQLDPVAGDELIGLLRRLNEEWGTAVVLAEHRLERCLAAADRAIALADGRIAFDGSPREFVRWALDHDPALATPGARLFELAGLTPPPVGVKEARSMLRHRGLELSRAPAPRTAARRPGGAREPALVGKGAWVELDHGTGARDALRGIDLRVSRGERVALMGRNGAGKTTLLRSAAGRLRTARGKVIAPAGCALLPQAPGDLLVRERVREELPGEAGAQSLEAVGLEWAGGADPRDLSGGERQRLALALVMAGRGAGGDLPGLICLDEPTRGLDRARKDSLARWTRDLSTRGTAVVIATHDVEFAAAFAERVVLLGTGETIADGPVADVLAGGWYFATEVARILGSGGAILPERGAEILRGRSHPAVWEPIRETR
ncbi:MAG TPA: ATP-binding cassette domain-containing protein [Solirubrobacterales bacterium]|nr:ATP-binding cassette domain-containing protein [Solirubrobacterales bacterium]